METKSIIISALNHNTGQIEGLPKNPRVIKDSRYKQLVKSIKEDPEMLELRELIVIPYKRNFVVIAGNQRLKACIELGYKEMICKVLPANTSIDKLKAITIKDNVSFGQHDWEALKLDWSDLELSNWGLDVEKKIDPIGSSSLQKNDTKKTKAIMIHFDLNEYDEAFALIKFFKDRGYNIGSSLVELLKKEKETL